MREVVLLGSPDTKRTIYLEKAARREGLPIAFVDWKSWSDFQRLPAAELFVKVDPPLWSSCSLEELNWLADSYVQQLKELGRLAQQHRIVFWNSPSAIIELLDKRACKARLQRAGLPATEMMRTPVLTNNEKLTVEQLFEEMYRQRMHQVFIKPVRGSGAAGVSALRLQPQTGRMALYSCALIQADGALVNTKCLRRFSKAKEILPLLERILAMDCIVERWYAKAEYQGCSYDLRAVVQEGRLDFLLGRLSKGPITNLHLNNKPLELAALKLPAHTLEDIAELCQKSMQIYPGLRSAGIDILLEKGSMKPRIIEMNAQGDLIYQDIYNENSIYGHQVRIMQKWLCQNKL